ncbi:hypothetical protein OM076_00645 [Solirubrobacter ginsenosidimutans]|uniref:Uncharacterized protein n=1 Tax=Solirubrobacter ginsenosidimutans TaxID=490573 RepID=A0A9X3MMC7_9ACTN|nr:hypothetical protein [Solirubrobacter ginsenosidimutans]MDA0158755.1 hypothetical protein [Solirubrobacter ginsenosidimutans]
MPIRDELRVDIEGPMNGWVAVAIVAGSRRYAFDASFTPNDAIAELVSALLAVASFETTRQVSWNDEPTQHRLDLARTGDEIRLALTTDRREGPDSSVAFAGSVERVVGPFVVALENLQRRQGADVYAREWRHPFPATAVEHLRAVLAHD